MVAIQLWKRGPQSFYLVQETCYCCMSETTQMSVGMKPRKCDPRCCVRDCDKFQCCYIEYEPSEPIEIETVIISQPKTPSKLVVRGTSIPNLWRRKFPQLSVLKEDKVATPQSNSNAGHLATMKVTPAEDKIHLTSFAKLGSCELPTPVSHRLLTPPCLITMLCWRLISSPKPSSLYG
jgi:hypothetical protein